VVWVLNKAGQGLNKVMPEVWWEVRREMGITGEEGQVVGEEEERVGEEVLIKEEGRIIGEVQIK
jgi:hypothetical protein